MSPDHKCRNNMLPVIIALRIRNVGIYFKEKETRKSVFVQSEAKDKERCGKISKTQIQPSSPKYLADF